MGAQQPATVDWICAPGGIRYRWVDRGSVEYDVCQALLSMDMQYWELNPRPFDLEYNCNTLSTWPHAPAKLHKCNLRYYDLLPWQCNSLWRYVALVFSMFFK